MFAGRLEGSADVASLLSPLDSRSPDAENNKAPRQSGQRLPEWKEHVLNV